MLLALRPVGLVGMFMSCVDGLWMDVSLMVMKKPVSSPAMVEIPLCRVREWRRRGFVDMGLNEQAVA